MSGRLPRGLPTTPRPGDVRVRMPLLERLRDDDPAQRQDPPMTASQVHVRLLETVKADLEALLNARRSWRPLPEGCEALLQSPLGFGLSDFAAGAFNSLARRQQLCNEVQTVIERFEKRLTDVRVTLATSGVADATLRLRIHAQLNADPVNMPIGFDTVVHATTTDIDVRQSRDV